LLGVIFKETSMAPLTAIPLKGDYSRRDFARSARFHGVEFSMPAQFPIATIAAARIVLWVKSRNPELATRVAKALYRAYFLSGIDMAGPEQAIAVAASVGVDANEARAAIADPAVKDQLKREVEQAIARGVFGSPFVIVDGEPFWGLDRFDQIDRWLASG